MKDARTQSQSPAIDIEGVLIFDLFAIRSREPFIVMYGFSSAYGYKLEDWQKEIVQKNLESRAIFEKWQAIGKECKTGARPLPEWVTDSKVQR
jgi:hypothetical protein